MTSGIALFLLFLAAAGLSKLANRAMEECWSVCFSGMVCWLYAFYFLGQLRVGLAVLCAGMIALFLTAWKKEKSLCRLLKRSITPGTAVYLCLCTVFVIFLSRNRVSLHDELRLWGAVPKAMHVSGKLQLGKESPIFSIMQSYPPGLPLIGYFFTAFRPSFDEGALYVGYACASAAFFLPALSKFEWKHRVLLAPIGMLLLLAPCVFTSHFCDGAMFGMTLFVDALLGILAGYVFFLAGHQPFRSWFDASAFSLGLALLCLLKSTGIVFAAAALVCAIVLERKCLKKRCAISIAAVIVCAGSWRILLQIYDVHDLVGLEFHTLDGTVLHNLLQAMTSVNVVAYRVPLGFLLSFASVFTILWLLYYAAFRFQTEQKGADAAVIACGILIAAAAFIYGYALIYGQTLESFARYMETVLLCLFTCILLTALPLCRTDGVWEWIQKKVKSKRASGAISIGCVLFSLAIFGVWCAVFPGYSQIEEMDREAMKIQTAVEQDLGESDTGWIYLVIAGDEWENSRLHHRIFFDLISEKINIRNGLAQTRVALPGLENPTEVWAEELKDGCGYVYLLSVEQTLIPIFAELTQDPAIAGRLYRVCEAENAYGVTLQLVS